MAQLSKNEALTSIGQRPVDRLLHSNSHAYSRSFEVDAPYPVGTVLTLQSNGVATAQTAESEIPLGYVYVPATAAGERATVLLKNVNGIVKGLASGAVTTGQAVRGDGADGANFRAKYAEIASASTPIEGVAGICLEGGADTEDIIVGIY